MKFAHLILPLPVKQTFTYSLGDELGEVLPGMRVLVQFGKRKLYTGLVIAVDENPPGYETKPVLAVEDETPVVIGNQIKLWDWMADYYMCSRGEVMQAALPAGLKIQSETRLMLVDDDLDDTSLTDNEFLIIEALRAQTSIEVNDVSKITGVKNPMSLIRKMYNNGWIELDELAKHRVKPKRERAYRYLGDPKNSQETFEQLKSAPKQAQALLSWFTIHLQSKEEWIREPELLIKSGLTRANYKALVEKGVLEETTLKTLPPVLSVPKPEPITLSPVQEKALNDIHEGWMEKEVVLLHGVTSSGKTEIYIRLIQEQLKLNRQTLYLLPEIALTFQMIRRLQAHFGDQVVVFHSKMSERERMDVWQALLHPTRKPGVILAARSGLFLPIEDLGLIIVDEEHESSYKQYDPAPRYQGRDTAIVMGMIAGAKVLLGSATPSLESMENAQQGKYGLATLSERYGGVRLPVIEAVDLKKAHMRKEMQSHFAPRLLQEIKETLELGQKVILFQNRRGFAPVLTCQSCGHHEECVNCDISLTYHKGIDMLKCHYCGYAIQPPKQCKSCKSTDLKLQGFGTEKVEEELAELIPTAKIARMDLDATRKKEAFQDLIDQFESGEINVLIGTQMVTKGLDFDDVRLVGVLQADNLLNYPDFRAHERGYQLMAQVGGRAGRREDRGLVLIQSFNPDHRIIQQVTTHDFEEMVKEQLFERKQYQYPPYVRMVVVSLRHRKPEITTAAANWMAEQLRKVFGKRILGPEYASVARMKGMYNKQIIIKLERGIPTSKAKGQIKKIGDQLMFHTDFKSVRVVYDVDPG